MRKRSIKNTRVNTEVQHELSNIIRGGLKDPQSAEGYIRRELARTLNLRNTPEIKFVLDQSIEYGVNMSKKIDEVTKDLKTEGVEEDAE